MTNQLGGNDSVDGRGGGKMEEATLCGNDSVDGCGGGKMEETALGGSTAPVCGGDDGVANMDRGALRFHLYFGRALLSEWASRDSS